MSSALVAMGLQPRRPGQRGLQFIVLPVALALIHSAVPAADAADSSDLFGSEAPSHGGHKNKHKEAKGRRLIHHSFGHALSFEDTLGDWLFSAASMPLRDRVELLPPVPDRHGIGFNKRSVDTSDFEVEFALGAVSPASGPEDGYITFWVGPQNYTADFNDLSIITVPDKDWSQGMTDKGFTLFDNKPTFEGLALAFFAENGKQTIAGLWNDGSKSAAMSDFTSGASHKEIDWLNRVVEAKVRFEKSGAVAVHVAVHDAQELISGSTWSWASDGVRVDSMVKFEKDGTTVPKGTWSMLPGNKLKLELEGRSHKRKYVVRLEGVHRAGIIQGAKEPKPALMRFDTRDGQDTVQTKWQELLKLPAGTYVQQKSYIGFTGYTGKSAYIEADVHRLWMTNMDVRKVRDEF